MSVRSWVVYRGLAVDRTLLKAFVRMSPKTRFVHMKKLNAQHQMNNRLALRTENWIVSHNVNYTQYGSFPPVSHTLRFGPNVSPTTLACLVAESRFHRPHIVMDEDGRLSQSQDWLVQPLERLGKPGATNCVFPGAKPELVEEVEWSN